jgi:hypothetical protein
MSKAKDLTGQIFGRLLVIKRVERPENSKRSGTYWLCYCENDGNEIIVNSNELLRGDTKSCGCLVEETSGKDKFIDLTGQIFGRLTVLRRVEKKENVKQGIFWLCRCENDGNLVIINGISLKSGATQSCGCLNLEIVKKRSTINLIGKKFGDLLVIQQVVKPEDKKARDTYWLCRCEKDGNEIILRGSYLRSGKVLDCGCGKKIKREVEREEKVKAIIGKVFSKLVVLERAPDNKDGDLMCLCRCEAEGNLIIVEYNNLITGHTTSCGCMKGRILPYGTSAFNRTYSKYKKGAKKRNLIFDLTKEEFMNLTQENCYYCDIKPHRVQKKEPDNGSFIYNGIDRLDNTKGYTIDNCVPCCSICNYAKLTMTEQDFYAWICRVYDFSARDRYYKHLYINLEYNDYQI